ncbi:heat shock 70 kDa protein 12A-like [Mya arenaria]|uniref:heat shock 70 kDa protein 12A-like n=1 Tax=Mya arenaria TaxID=6604 RepID=UPI0022E3D102|nr:heat shock 70 kDa protein 12A-like [Mya arenaria]
MDVDPAAAGEQKLASASDQLLVAAIDFGTTYSGYAFSFRHDYERDALKISNNTSWTASGQGLTSWKTPTTVLLEPDKSFHSFGYEAEEKYIELAEDEKHQDWFYFQRFKMLLHDKLGLKRDVLIPDASGKEMEAKKIFAIAIRYLKDHLLKMILNKGIEFYEEDILWVLTIPAIWSEPAKQFMREAAVEAGIPGVRLKLALEPEAASVYCKTVPLERRQDDEQRLTLGPFCIATRYLVLDIGGGTVDVTVHEVKPDGTLKELHKASGGAWGGTKVDQAYMELYENLLGKDVMEEFKHKSKFDFLDMHRDFEIKKRNLNIESENINIRLSAALADHTKEMTNKTVAKNVEIKGFSDRINVRRDRMTLKVSVIKKMFQPSIDSIISHVKEVLRSPKVNNRIDKILMVGGFSESSVVRKAIREAFPDVAVVAPDEPGLAVLKGAVIFGHSPSSISTRVVRYTYGVAVTVDFDPGYHPEDKMFIDNQDRKLISDCFSKFVTIDENVDEDDMKSREYEIRDKQAPFEITVYASTDENPVMVTDADCVKLGRIEVKPPIGGWRQKAKVTVEFGFGGTEVRVTATENLTQIQHEVTFDFLS